MNSNTVVITEVRGDEELGKKGLCMWRFRSLHISNELANSEEQWGEQKSDCKLNEQERGSGDNEVKVHFFW